MPISQYLTHTVTIVKVNLKKGAREEEEISNVPAFICSKRSVVRGVSGDHFVDQTLVFLEHDANVTEQDEIKVDNVATPIAKITAPRSTRSSTESHLEVLLND